MSHSAHGVPQSYVASGDLYQQHIEESVLLLSDQVSQTVALSLPPAFVCCVEIISQNSPIIFVSLCLCAVAFIQISAIIRSEHRPSCQANGEDSASLETLNRVRTALDGGRLRFHLSYQSRVGPVQWLRPYTDDRIKEFGKVGVRNLAVVPVAFVSEHIETLEEIDGEYRLVNTYVTLKDDIALCITGFSTLLSCINILYFLSYIQSLLHYVW